MARTWYGEPHPPLTDDRLAVVLVVLEGLGDRPVPALGGRTPAEAADTPVLDELTRRSANGLHLPFGWGRAATPEIVHWALLGMDATPFCGRAVLEALGAGIPVESGLVVAYAELRPSEERDGAVWILGRAAPADDPDATELLAAVDDVSIDGIEFRLHPLRGGEAVLALHGAPGGDLTDTDPRWPERHPFLRPVPVEGHPDSGPTAAAMEHFLAHARDVLVGHPVNQRRRKGDLPALDVLTTRWAGRRQPLPSFTDRVGCAGAAVTADARGRGLAELLGMGAAHADPLSDPGADIAHRVALAGKLLDRGAAFVHLHSRAGAEAGHAKDPQAKRDIIEALDRGLAHLPALAERSVVAVTADGATPSSGGLIHSGDPSPFLVAGPTVRADIVDSFGESHAAAGSFGTVGAVDVLPILLGYANRPRLLGHRATHFDTAGFPDDPAPFAVDQPGN